MPWGLPQPLNLQWQGAWGVSVPKSLCPSPHALQLPSRRTGHNRRAPSKYSRPNLGQEWPPPGPHDGLHSPPQMVTPLNAGDLPPCDLFFFQRGQLPFNHSICEIQISVCLNLFYEGPQQGFLYNHHGVCWASQQPKGLKPPGHETQKNGIDTPPGWPPGCLCPAWSPPHSLSVGWTE